MGFYKRHKYNTTMRKLKNVIFFKHCNQSSKHSLMSELHIMIIMLSQNGFQKLLNVRRNLWSNCHE